VEIVFWLAIAAIFYVYIGYPCCASLIVIFRGPRIVRKKAWTPRVTILIAAYNEERDIAKTIENKLALEYPADCLEIIVISDGSTDRTDEIVLSYRDKGVRLLRQERAGKTAALNAAIGEAGGEIIVFSDANSIYSRDALQHLVSNLAAEDVGYVTGKMVYTDAAGNPVGDGCSAYMRYENFLRSIETRLGSIVGVDGGIDAMRKKLYSPLRPDMLPDFVLPLRVIEQGYRVVYEPRAVLKEQSLESSADEYGMRVRVCLRSWWAIFQMRHLLWGKGGLLFAWQFWSHKVLRYSCFLFFVIAYVANGLLLATHWLYGILFILQNLGYLGAWLAYEFEKQGRSVPLLYYIQYIVLINVASGQAFFRFLSGRKLTLWTPRKGG